MCVVNSAPQEPREAVFQRDLLRTRFEAVDFDGFVSYQWVIMSAITRAAWSLEARLEDYEAYLADFREDPLLIPEGLRRRVAYE